MNRQLKLLALACGLFFGFGLEAASEPALAPHQTLTAEKFRSTTVRLRLRRLVGDYIYTEHGSAFGIDLSSYGVLKSRYLITAAHCVLTNDSSQLATGDLLCELPSLRMQATEFMPKAEVVDPDNPSPADQPQSPACQVPQVIGHQSQGQAEDLARYDGGWTKCRVLAVDRKNDLCLLQCEKDIPVVSLLGPLPSEPHLGSALMVVGCPSGVPPAVSVGTLVKKNVAEYGRLWMAAANFGQGNSGGPVFQMDTGQLIGVAVAGIPDKFGKFDHQVCLFVPQNVVLDFVKRNLSVLRKPKDQESEPQPPATSAPTPAVLGF